MSPAEYSVNYYVHLRTAYVWYDGPVSNQQATVNNLTLLYVVKVPSLNLRTEVLCTVQY